jgi:hypothetical protein
MPRAVVAMDPRVKPEADKLGCGKRGATTDKWLGRKVQASHSVVILGLDPRIHRSNITGLDIAESRAR